MNVLYPMRMAATLIQRSILETDVSCVSARAWLTSSMKLIFRFLVVLPLFLNLSQSFVVKRSFRDESVSGYLTERICWWNEVCKEEFQTQFRCKCPTWSFCRSPGRYYNAFCSVAETGYIWKQPTATWGIAVDNV